MLVETQALTKSYGNFAALDNCSLQIAEGEIFGLLGPNGAGKSTLLRLLMGFLRPTSGWAKICGLDCDRQSVQVHQQVAYLPGDARLFRRMKGQEVLRFFTSVRPNGNYQRALELARRLDLEITRRVAFMSTGMRQKLALAAVLAIDSPVLILDEPTANLDPNVRHEIIQMVLEAKRTGRTVILSSHVLSEIEESCDRVVILRQGQLVHSQRMAELRQRHRVRLHTATSPSIPPELLDSVQLVRHTEQETLLEVTGSLTPSLSWLASLGDKQLSIENVGLRSVYDQYHGAQAV